MQIILDWMWEICFAYTVYIIGMQVYKTKIIE